MTVMVTLPCDTLLERNHGKMTERYKTDASEITGSSITHINLVSLVALVRPPNIYHYLGQASVPLFAAIQRRQPTQPLSFLSSWLVLVLPLLLSMTLFANHPIILLALRSVPTRLLLYSPMPNLKSGTLQSRQPRRLPIRSGSLLCRN